MALGMRGVLPAWGVARQPAPARSQSFSALPVKIDEEELAVFRQYRERRYSNHKQTLSSTFITIPSFKSGNERPVIKPASERKPEEAPHQQARQQPVTERKADEHSPSPAFLQNFPRRELPQWSPRFATFLNISGGTDAHAVEVCSTVPKRASRSAAPQEADEGFVLNLDSLIQSNPSEPQQETQLKAPKGSAKRKPAAKKEKAPQRETPAAVAPVQVEDVPANSDVLVVDNEEIARNVVEILTTKYKDEVHACDTEVAGIDIRKESPVGHGHVICFSIYCGPKANFGDGKCRLWVDVLDNGEILDVFKPYFEDPSIKKVWHNYSFDAHILGNHGIKAAGFYADTMHLARLLDSARAREGGYSLEALSSDPSITMGLPDGHFGGGKTSMKDLFARTNIKKDGTEGKLQVVPPVEELQTMVDTRAKWIHYSAYDAVCTWHLWDSLQKRLQHEESPWVMDGVTKGTMYDFYKQYWRPFGELLVQMETEGMLVDRSHLADVEKIALTQKQLSITRFQKWASTYCSDAIYMNVCSDAQVRQLLFGGVANKSDRSSSYPTERAFKVPNTENYVEPGAKAAKKYRTITLKGIGVKIPVDVYTPSGWPAVSGPVLKSLAGNLPVDYEEDEVEDLCFSSRVLTSAGVEGSSDEDNKEDLSVYGKAYSAFGRGETGKKACMAIAALCELTSIDTLISNFIQPLQNGQIMGADGRVHCSLNINTETGRLSARRPNLQNQPALEKDRYKIRHAFVAGPGMSLIVADYGQLELRILAHLTGCQSMLQAFEAGGDFHSRTALNMYPHVRQAVDEGKALLEWDGEGNPPVPLLKDLYGSERRKAKMLNFSIAYGKTARGLAKDWKVSVSEAQKTLELWYDDRSEVKEWQERTIEEAKRSLHVKTLLGRRRHLPHIQSSDSSRRFHFERAAINTPVQGSAADVAMCAMLEINRNARLRQLGWKLILQVHDEVILEGPSASCEEAKELVVKCMSFPFDGENFLKVKLDVDAAYARTWYEAK